MTEPVERPVFDPVDTSFDPDVVSMRDDVESPSLTSGNALARFEFEPGKSKDGTKVLMVEWEEDESTKAIKGDWEIRWEGKKTVYPARELSPRQDGEVPVNRLYFLLGPGVSVPSTVKLQKGSLVWRTNPLPAIFAPELGATARQAGKRGVLHTIWAKKRLQVLQKEIDNESQNNTEGIGLEMAIAEKNWIEQNFGVSSKPGSISLPLAGYINDPSSPRSPGGGRLMDKLKGLKIGTNVEELHSKGADNFHNPLSPETADVAVGGFSSFAAIKGPQNSSPPASRSSQSPKSQSQSQSPQKIVSHAPPASFASQQRQHGGMGSLNAFASGETSISPNAVEGDDEDADLFALPMSPRIGAETRGAFSFGPQDTMKYVKGETARAS